MEINTELNKLTKPDITSFMLFALYKLRDIPEYSAISELSYVLDMQNLLKLCEYFGSTTIRIPTISELEAMVNALLLYQYVDVENIPYEDAIKLLNYETHNYQPIKNEYLKMKALLEEYKLTSRDLA